MLRDLASWLDGLVVDLRENDLAVFVDEVVVPLVDMICEPFDVQEGCVD